MQHLEVDESQVLSNFEAYILNPNAAKRSSAAVNGVGGLKRGAVHALASAEGEPSLKKKKHAVVAEDQLVAAKVNDNWILCKVIKYLKRKKTYRVRSLFLVLLFSFFFFFYTKVKVR